MPTQVYIAIRDARRGWLIVSVSMASASAPPVDILVTDAESRPIAVVEVKNKVGLSRDDATRLLRDLTTYPSLPDAAYYLVVSQEHGYLWKAPLVAGAPPTVQFAMDSVIERYGPALAENRRLRGGDVTVAVARWLIRLANEKSDVHNDPESAVRDTGFIAAMQGAVVVPEPYG
jgi:hypothetical protein